MKIYQIIKLISITTFIAIVPYISTTMAQTGNLTTGEGSGENITSANHTTVFGDSAGVYLTTGQRNTFFGYHSGYNTTTGFDNTYIGYQAGYSATNDYDNLMIGYQAGLNNLGSDNTFMGYQAGEENTSGNDNTLIGYLAGNRQQGDDNIFIGRLAGYDIEGDDNIFIGYDVGSASLNTSTGSYNIGIGGAFEGGVETLSNITTGSNNTVLGFDSAPRLSTDNNSTYIGTGAGRYSQGGGEDNTFIGYRSGAYSGYAATVDNNTFAGCYTGVQSNKGSNNAFIGYDVDANVNSSNYSNSLGIGSKIVIRTSNATSLGYNGDIDAKYTLGIGYNHDINSYGSIGIGYAVNTANGNYSIGVGSNADVDNAYAIGIGTNVDIDNTNAIAIGHNTSATGDYSIAFGANASVSGTNSIALGNGVSVATDNTITIGNDQVTSIRGTVNWTTLSDGRYKTDVQENVAGLTFIEKLRPVSYELKSQEGIRYSGFIAQEVEATAQEIGYDFSGVKMPENDNDIYGLRYAEFVVPLTKAVQELDAQHQNNEATILNNEVKLAEYKTMIATLKAKVEMLKQAKQQVATANDNNEFTATD